MNFHILAASAVFLLSVCIPGFAQGAGEKADASAAGKAPMMPVYITPYYNSNPFQISVGDHSKELTGADAKTILSVSDKLKEDKDKLRAEVMYVLAIRLYDLGQKDESVYWFYTAQYRGRVFGSILEPTAIGEMGSPAFELGHAYNAFAQLAGTYINGYAFGDLKNLGLTLAKVQEEGKTLPNYVELYPEAKFIPQSQWAAKNKEISDGLNGLMDYIKTSADSIKEERRKNGIEGKY